MIRPVTFTVAGQADIRNRLNTDGVAALGLGAPLLSQVWTQAVPTANLADLSFTVTANWFAPIAGMIMAEPNPSGLGLTCYDGTQWQAGGPAAVLFKIHPQARLRLERLMVANLQPAGATPIDQSIRPVPSIILINNPSATFTVPQICAAGDLTMPAGTVYMFDDHGLPIDPLAFAGAVAAVLAGAPADQTPMPTNVPAGTPTGTPLAIANTAPGQFIHAIDLHGRPWQAPPGQISSISIYSGQPGSLTQVDPVGDGLLHAWPSGQQLTLAGDIALASGMTATAIPTLIRFGWHPLGRMNSTPLSWPAAGPQVPVRDTLRVVVCDPEFHLLGNWSAAPRDGLPPPDIRTQVSDKPQIREGSPVTLLPDGRSALGWMGQVILNLQGGNPAAAFNTGPMFAASPFIDGNWPFPTAPGPAGAWPLAPAAIQIPGNDAAVLTSLAPLRTGGSANWIAGTNDVLVTLSTALPAGIAIRLYPLQIKMGISPDEQPLLRRADGPGLITTGANDTLRLVDPFALGPNAVRPAQTPTLRVDAAATWQPGPDAAGNPQVARVKLIGNLQWSVGPDVAAPAPPPGNILSAMFWRGWSRNPMIGAPSPGPFPLASALGDPIAFMQAIVRSLTTDANPREAPRLPTMSRNESLFALQLLPAAGPDLYRAFLTGGWLTSETDVQSPRLANPGGAGMHEVHAPAITATSQLGFDLWVAAAHRARPIVPTADVAAVFTSGPIAGLPNNWLMLQANATSVPPAPPAAPTTIAAALLQTVPAYVETPELAIIPDNDLPAAVNWVTNQLGNWVTTPNDTELHRQIGRELRSANYGRRDSQWALRRAFAHARELVYIETPLLSMTATGNGAPPDPAAAADVLGELALRMRQEPRLRVIILTPRETPFGPNYHPFSAYFYAARNQLAATFAGFAPEPMDGLNTTRPRFIIAHPVGMPGRPMTIHSSTVIVDDVWCMTGASSLSRRGLTFDGSNDVVLTDWLLDRGASTAIRNHRKALMATHLGVGPTPVGGGAPPNIVGAPSGDWVRLHNPITAHEAFADCLAAGHRTKLLPLWAGPDPLAPESAIAHPASVADPDGLVGQAWVNTLAATLGGGSAIV
ncbi:hypothetical protein [Rhizobium sp. SYY.PMSO]|uniref:hypothetical protein n=1 Tax=Rhizobium sp. SYY.PMSO TaxID=3382192 RepID=UPI0039900606